MNFIKASQIVELFTDHSKYCFKHTQQFHYKAKMQSNRMTRVCECGVWNHTESYREIMDRVKDKGHGVVSGATRRIADHVWNIMHMIKDNVYLHVYSIGGVRCVTVTYPFRPLPPSAHSFRFSISLFYASNSYCCPMMVTERFRQYPSHLLFLYDSICNTCSSMHIRQQIKSLCLLQSRIYIG